MIDSISCTKYSNIKIDGKIFKRVTSPELNKPCDEWGKNCGDCGILMEEGNIHHFGCDIERCPRCDGQLIGCGCKKVRLVK